MVCDNAGKERIVTQKEYYDFREEENTRQVSILALVRGALKKWKIILLADHTKFDHTSLIRSASFSMINALITDRRPSDEWMTCMEEENVRVLYPEE